jgi:hypothetical protein
MLALPHSASPSGVAAGDKPDRLPRDKPDGSPPRSVTVTPGENGLIAGHSQPLLMKEVTYTYPHAGSPAPPANDGAATAQQGVERKPSKVIPCGSAQTLRALMDGAPHSSNCSMLCAAPPAQAVATGGDEQAGADCRPQPPAEQACPDWAEQAWGGRGECFATQDAGCKADGCKADGCKRSACRQAAEEGQGPAQTGGDHGQGALSVHAGRNACTACAALNALLCRLEFIANSGLRCRLHPLSSPAASLPGRANKPPS